MRTVIASVALLGYIAVILAPPVAVVWICVHFIVKWW